MRVTTDGAPVVRESGLANTGTHGTWAAVAGGLVLSFGAALVLISRRRRA
ncbi:LPXTG cell wall anchor domain-containing protein [Arthrobacter sp. zg-Y809]|uniref:LPXTG cell wall anchor domain-containing protein n=1 Tax=Arthrobacter gengyunqii TaxID=2886940 RepID=A0A9X1LY78_9MICC|nr:LPXTG cell wall anchor domain-containing protein [Arthrobacter gengyunqii]